MILSLASNIMEYTGITNVFVADIVTGIVFSVGILLIVGIVSKFFFRMV